MCCWSSRMIEKIMVVAPDHRGADEHRLGRRLEGVARAVVVLEEVLALREVGLEAELLLDLLRPTPGVVSICDSSKMTARCRSPGRRSRRRWSPGPCPAARRRPGRRRTPPRRLMKPVEPLLRHQVGDEQQDGERERLPEHREVAGHQAREDGERGAALARGRDDLACTWRECELVKTLVSSGITAAASVPHEMMIESFHHSPPPEVAQHPAARRRR